MGSSCRFVIGIVPLRGLFRELNSTEGIFADGNTLECSPHGLWPQRAGFFFLLVAVGEDHFVEPGNSVGCDFEITE